MNRFGVYTAVASAVFLLLLYSFPVIANATAAPASSGLWLLGVMATGSLVFILWPLVARSRDDEDDFLASQLLDDEDQRRSVYAPRILAIVCATIIFLVARASLIQPFQISNRGMEPNFSPGRFLYVSKFAYGYGKASFPLALLDFDGRILGSFPDRGDVIIYRNERDFTDNIARVIGLPNDRIQMIGGVLQINGTSVKTTDTTVRRTDLKGNLKTETLPNGVTFATLDMVSNGVSDNTPVYTVPSRRIFVMGDNRDNTTDSRMLNQVGYVAIGNVVGKVLSGQNSLRP